MPQPNLETLAVSQLQLNSLKEATPTLAQPRSKQVIAIEEHLYTLSKLSLAKPTGGNRFSWVWSIVVDSLA
jgi:hypothetical protein